MKDTTRENAHLTGFGDTELEVKEDLHRKGREFFGGPIEITGYDGDAPRWYFGVVKGTVHSGLTDKKLYAHAYVRPIQVVNDEKPHVISDTSHIYDGRAPKLARVRWQVTGTGWYWDDFTVSASSMPEALAKAEDILKNREGIAQITSITREGSK